MPYKIMLVDDEEEVRTSIIKRMDWHRLGFHVVGDAENGEDAMEKIPVLDPDVIITDIQMPYMDGLELTAAIRENYPEKEVVIFSGFNDFEYAKQGIKLGVTEYILKPINSEELAEVLKKLKEKLDKKLDAKRDITILRDSYRKNYPVLQEKFLRDWMDGVIGRAALNEAIEEYAKDLKNYQLYLKWVVAIINIKEKEEDVLQHEKALRPISVKKIIADNLQQSFAYHTFNYEQEIGIIFALRQDQNEYDVVAKLNQIGKECKQIFDLDISIGVGERKQSLERLPKSFQEAKEAVGYRNVIGLGSAIYIKDVEPQKCEVLEVSSQEENLFTHTLKFGTQEEIEEMIDMLVSKTRDTQMHWRQLQSYFMNLLTITLQVIWKYELEEQSIFEYGVDYYETLIRMNTEKEVKRFMLAICGEIHKQMIIKREATTIDIVKEAKEYITENYTNPKLSVEMICKHLHLSQSYFSTIFKKETGENYITFLTEVRLSKALELLNNTEEKTYMIATKVGYTEPNYFSYVFKKRFGVSPSKYKGKI